MTADFEAPPLPFSPEKQEALLGHLLSDEKLFAQGAGLIRPDLFVDPWDRQVWKAAIDFRAEWSRMPTDLELRESSGLVHLEAGARNKAFIKLFQARRATVAFGLDVLRLELDNWIQGAIYRKTVETSAKLFNKGKLAEALQQIRQMTREVDSASFSETNEVDFSSPAAMLAEQAQTMDNALTFGVGAIDRILLKEGKNGGLCHGDMTTILGTTNVGKCHSKDTPVIMFDGTVKMVQDVVVGDLLMGPDGLPRKVLSTTTGTGALFEIVPKAGGVAFGCNDVHVLSLKKAWGANKGQIVNIALDDFLKKSPEFQRSHRLWRAALEFSEKTQPIPAYVLGMWLGDGHSDRAALTTADPEMADEWISWVKSNGDSLSTHEAGRATMYTAVSNKKGTRSNRILAEIGVLRSKHIPHVYKTGSRRQRLELLAGLLDSDGSYSGSESPNFEIIQKDETLASDIAFVARSLGFKVTQSLTKKSDQNGTEGEYTRLVILGSLSEIPTRLPRKRAKDGKKDSSTTGFRVLDKGQGEYFGFTLDGDHLYLLGDFTVTHNTTILITVAKHNVIRGKSVLFLSHEGRPSDIQEKIWRSVLGVDRLTLGILNETEAGRARLARASAYLSRFFTYLPLHRPSLTVEELEGVILRQNEKRRAKYGAGFDLVVDDYPAKLQTITNSKGNLARRQKDEYVYDYLNRLASEEKFHALVSIQGNREASKVNKGVDKKADSRLLDAEDVSEAFGAMMVSTNILTANRPERAKAEGWITFNLCKSRSSETGIAVVCKTDYSCATTHSDQLGATWYRGSSTMADKAQSLLEQYAEKEVPYEQID